MHAEQAGERQANAFCSHVLDEGGFDVCLGEFASVGERKRQQEKGSSGRPISDKGSGESAGERTHSRQTNESWKCGGIGCLQESPADVQSDERHVLLFQA